MKKLKRTKTWWATLGLLFLLLLAGAENLFPQRRMRERIPGPNQARLAERFDMLMKMRLVEVLDLSSEQGDKFLPVFNQYRKQTRQLLKARSSILQSLSRHVRARLGTPDIDEEPVKELSERELKEHLARLDELRRQQEANRDEFYQRAGQVLSIEQLARLTVFEEMFAREILKNLPKP